jgi:acetyltransferase-like isoleucine patch superfamily enzyme
MPVTSVSRRDEYACIKDVIRDVKANAIVAGNPAKLLRYITTSHETS